MAPRGELPAIGVLSPLLGGFYFGGILDGVAHAAAESGYATVAFQCLPAGVTAEEQHNHRRESAERAHVCIHESLRRDTT